MPSSTLSVTASRSIVCARAVKLTLMGLFLLTVGIWLGSRTLLGANFLPHSLCYLGNQRLLWTNVIADAFIGLSYVSIAATLVWLAQRAGRDLPYSRFFCAFGLFLVSCAATHFLEMVTVWKPLYWLLAATKVITAAASAGTAVVLLVAADDMVRFVRTAREAAARRGNEQFRTLINAAPIAIVSADLQGKITAWNPSAERLYGWPAGEAVGNILSLLPPEKLAEQTELRRRIHAGEMITGLETLRLNRNGEPFPVAISAAALVGENGAITGVMEILEDIGGRKRTELELKENTEVLSTVTQALNSYLEEGNWKAASQHLLTFAIEKTQSEYGLLGVVLDGSILRILAHDGAVWDAQLNRELYEEKIKQHASEGYFEVAHFQNLLGEVVNKGEIVVSNSPQTDPRSGGLPAGHPPLSAFLGVPIFKGSETVGLIAVANRQGGYAAQELSYLQTMSQATGVLYDSYRQNLKRGALEEEQKRLETQVRQAQKMEVLGRLAGGVAHDFNNMLMVLGGSSELLDRALPEDSPARLYVDQIQRTTEKAAAITKQLLAFSRKQVFELRPMNLNEALRETEFMLPRLLGSDIQLTFQHEAGKPWILSDASQIEQVVANLAINARDAMPDGGHLAISTRNASRLPEEGAGSASPSEDWVVLEVSDTGTGMDEKTRAQVFEPFFTTKPPGKGTGLGLATVYGIVKQSGGHIHLESAPCKGTRFELYFPALKTEITRSPEPPAVEAEEKSGSGTTILVADDEVALRHAVAEFLRSSGYTVLDARTAAEAVEIAEQQRGKLDILLTDIVMPGLRGTELARRVTQIHPRIQVVYMSGYAEGFPEAQLPPNSIFLQKPFRFATLLEQLKLVRRRA